jgi:hypothetical protein
MSNKIFTNTHRIDLDNSYYLKSDGASGIEMVFHETRQRKNKTTDELEDYTFEDHWWFTRITQALSKYADLTQNSSKTIEEILDKTNKIDKLLEKLNAEFMQFN